MVFRWRTHVGALVGVAGGVSALYLVQLRNYLLFHSLAELGSILIAAVVFLITWNAREELDRSFLVVLGVSYLFVAGVDLLHVLTYKGMGVFPDTGPNLPTQLWVLGRYLEAGSLLAAGSVGLVVGERDDIEWTGYTL